LGRKTVVSMSLMLGLPDMTLGIESVFGNGRVVVAKAEVDN